MATRKLKNFEFAGYRHSEDSEFAGQHSFDSFETPNGFVFVVAGTNKSVEGNQQVCEIISERIKYYLENDEPGNPKDAVFNALVYANGFLFAKASKEPGFNTGNASGVCLLVSEGKVYYSWLGQVSLFLSTGKGRHSLSWPIMDNESKGEEVLFLGRRQIVNPGVCEKELIPVDGDMILIGTGAGWSGIREKNFCGILADSMPTHSKVQRLAKMASTDIPYDTVAAFLISFYNLNQTSRSFSEGVAPAEPSVFQKIQQAIENRKGGSLLKPVLIGLAIIILGYMAYDIFFFNPTKPVRLEPTTQIAAPAAPVTNDRPAETLPTETTQPKAAPPADLQYTVRRGDTWGRIYQQFEVCSWFIKNHPNNAGKFDSSGNPNLNSSLSIPIRYSGSRRLNPDFFQEFATELVGNACQNVNEDFKARVDRKFGQ